LPILIDEIVPPAETIAVPPAEIRGCNPNPASDPTETIIPPTGIFALFTSYPTEDAVPVNLILEIPAISIYV
jgi:hypothetical protein